MHDSIWKILFVLGADEDWKVKLESAYSFMLKCSKITVCTGHERKTEPIKEQKENLSQQVTFEQALNNEVLFVSYTCCDYFDFSTIFGWC